MANSPLLFMAISIATAWRVNVEESPGLLLSPGTRLTYSSGGQESPPWIIEAIVRDTTLGGIASCSVIQLRTSPTQQTPEVRAQCQRGDTLFAWDAASRSHRPLRPLGPGMSLELRGRTGTTSTFETGARAVERIGAHEVPVIATVVTTRDSTGRIVRRLRERFSLGLATATGGTFEVPDSASSQGWRIERAFELTRISPASAGAGAPAAALIGDFTDDYGIRYTITQSLWTQWPSARYHVQRWNESAGYLIARNDDTNPTDGGLWTRIDWIPLQAMPPYEWAFCLSAYKAPSAAAAESVTIARRDTPRTGCNGFPFSRMKRSAK